MRKLVDKLCLFIEKKIDVLRKVTVKILHDLHEYNILHKYLSWTIFYKCSRIPNFVKPNQFFNLWKVSNMTNNLPSRQLILRDILGHPTQTLALFRLVTQSFSYGERPSACEAIGFVANRGYSSSYLTGVLRLGKKLILFLSGDT